MRIFRIFLSSSFLIFCLAMSCKDNTRKKSDEISVNVLLDKAKNATDSSWSAMMKSDDNKILNLKRLVRELTLIEGGSESQLKALELKVDSLPNHRYDRNTMASSALIDLYDAKTNLVISEAKEAVTQNQNATKYQIVNQLVSEIQLADDSVLLYRKGYDGTVDQYRAFKHLHKKELRKSHPEFESMPEYSLFRLVP